MSTTVNFKPPSKSYQFVVAKLKKGAYAEGRSVKKIQHMGLNIPRAVVNTRGLTTSQSATKVAKTTAKTKITRLTTALGKD